MERYDAARIYLYRVLPWNPIGNPAAFMNIMWTVHDPRYHKPVWRGTPCQSIEECIRTIQYRQRDPNVLDIYACMSSQREYETREKNGSTFKVALRSQQNAEELRVLYADVDVKEGAYASTQEAVLALKDFWERSGIPRPTMLVSSGSGGLHIYWTLDKALSVAEWQPLANALAEAMRRFGVKADTACTVDAARVLRVPETYNSKTNPRKLVELSINNMLPYDYTVDQMRRALAPYMGAQVIPLTPRGKTSAPSEFSAGIEPPKAPLVNIQTIADAGCGFIKEALDTGGKAYSNPLWNLTTLCSVFSEGGREDAHRMASAHPEYSREDTDALFDRKAHEKEVKNLGWPSCQTVENSGCTSCAGCPLKSPGSRPFQFGRPTPPKTDDLGPLPHGYSRNPAGYIMRMKKGKEEGTMVQVPVAPVAIRDAWVQEEPWTLHFMARTSGDTFKQVSITTPQINSAEKFSATMGYAGIALRSDIAKEFRDFMAAWQTVLQRTKERVVSSAPYGWVFNHGDIEGFAYDGRVWTQKDSRPAGAADPEVTRQYRPGGELEAWKEAAKVITDMKSPERNAILAAAFAGPLVQFTGMEGLLINCYSTGSGFSKTTCMKLAQAVWGRPGISLGGLGDTPKSTFGKAAWLKNIPLFWDEIKSDQDKIKFSEIAFQLSKGTEDLRMKSDTTLRKRGEWKTLVMSACNDSVMEIVGRQSRSTDAGVVRVFEWELSPPKYNISGTAADQFVLSTQAHYGQAGLEYAKFLGANHAQIHKDVEKVRETLEIKLKVDGSERFLASSIACLYLGGLYSKRLGLTEIDPNALLEFLVKTFIELRKRISGTHTDVSKKSTTLNVLGQYLNEQRARRTLLTDTIWVKRGRATGGSIKVYNDASRIEVLDVQIAIDGRVRFTKASFRAWLEKNGYSITAMESFLKRNINMVEGFSRLGAGTELRTMQQYVFELVLPSEDSDEGDKTVRP